MTASTEFIVIRHGETVWNTEGRLQGHQDSALTPLGLRQAEALGERLAGERFDTIYSSDIVRAMLTAEAIARRTGHTIKPDARLRERNYGIFEGLTTAEIAERFPDDYRQFLTRQADYIIPEGESLARKYARVTACLDDLAARLPGRRIVLVTHGGVLSDLLRRAMEIPVDRRLHFKLYNASLNTFFINDGQWILGTWGEVAHLRQLAPGEPG